MVIGLEPTSKVCTEVGFEENESSCKRSEQRYSLCEYRLRAQRVRGLRISMDCVGVVMTPPPSSEREEDDEK